MTTGIYKKKKGNNYRALSTLFLDRKAIKAEMITDK